MKIAVIGDSHVGMLRKASSHSDFAHCHFGWMTRPNRRTVDLQLVGSCLSDTTDAGRRALAKMGMAAQIDLGTFDATVFVGKSVSMIEVAVLNKTHFVPAWLAAKKAKAIVRQRTHLQPMTEAAFLATLCAAIRNGRIYRWINALQGVLETPLFVVPAPFVSETALAPGATRGRAFRTIADWDIFGQLASVFNTAHLEVFRDFPHVSIVLQNPETVTQGFFTKEAFTRGSMKVDLSAPHDGDDIVHANEALGRLVLQDILKIME